MKKIITLILLIIVIVLSLFFGSKTSNNSLVFSEPSKDDNSIIAAYIYDEPSDTFPLTEFYSTEVVCKKKNGTASNATGTARWNGTKWVVKISNILEDGTTCNVYFDEPIPRMWSSSTSGQLLYGMKTNQSEPYTNETKPSGVTLTTPGQDISTTNEGIRLATDDYGLVYYYRGAVENNYVVFANMCWRIVRLTGDGSIKLVLYNYNPTNASNPCASSLDGNSKAYARVNNTTTSAFNTSDDKNTYIGYMYSNNPDSNNFNIAHANDVDSTILTFLKTWYDEKLRTYNNQLADVIWCNDKSIVTDTTYDPNSLSTVLGTGLGTDKTYYRATYRLNPANTANPSFICPNAGSDGKLSKFTASDSEEGNAKLYSNNKEYKIGLLTADEVVFAGSVQTSNTNNTFYLFKNNGLKTFAWTMSPYSFSGTRANVMRYYWSVSSGSAIDVNPVRPAIALKSDTTISGGVGTQASPFVVSQNN